MLYDYKCVICYTIQEMSETLNETKKSKQLFCSKCKHNTLHMKQIGSVPVIFKGDGFPSKDNRRIRGKL